MWRPIYRRWLSRREPRHTAALGEFYVRMELITRHASYSDFLGALPPREAGRYLLAFDRWLVGDNPRASARDYYWRSVLLNHFFPNPRQEQEDLDRAATLDPGNVDIWVSLGHLALARNRHDQAIAHYEAGIQASPTNFFPRYGKALACIKLGRFEEALREIDLALEAHPGATLGYETRGRIYEGLGEWGSALSDLDFALQSGQASPGTRLVRARIWARSRWDRGRDAEKPRPDDW